MFCPENYLSLYEINRAFEEAAWDFVRESPPPETPPSPPGEFQIDTGTQWETKAEAYRQWLLHTFMFEYSWGNGSSNGFHAFFPKNGLVRLSQEITGCSRIYFGPFPDSPDQQASMLEHVKDGPNWIEEHAFTIDPLKSYDEERDEGFLESPFYQTLSQLKGWIVCWRPPTWPYVLADLAKQCSIAHEMHEAKDEPIERTIARATRGRPQKGNGLIQKAIQNTYMERLKKRDLPHLQRESILVDATSWANRILGEQVPRSTMQRYLATVFEAMDAQK